MMMKCGKKKSKKYCGKPRRSSSSSSRSSCESDSNNSDSDYDNEKLKEFAKANAFLIENGFKNAKENLRVLK